MFKDHMNTPVWFKELLIESFGQRLPTEPVTARGCIFEVCSNNPSIKKKVGYDFFNALNHFDVAHHVVKQLDPNHLSKVYEFWLSHDTITVDQFLDQVVHRLFWTQEFNFWVRKCVLVNRVTY